MNIKTVEETYKKYVKFDHLIENTENLSEVHNPKFIFDMLHDFWQTIKYEAIIRLDDGK
jgi:hypothetical protein